MYNAQIRLTDTQTNAEPYIENDGVPFIIMGKKMMECHQGFDRYRKGNGKKMSKLPVVSIINGLIHK